MAWLRYWVVMSSFSILELVLDLMVSWVPGYLIAKCVFLVWCMAPIQNNGSNILFNMVSIINIGITAKIFTHRLCYLFSKSTMIKLTA